MKFTLSWLKEHLDTTASVDEIAETLTDLGLEVEEVVNPADKLLPAPSTVWDTAVRLVTEPDRRSGRLPDRELSGHWFWFRMGVPRGSGHPAMRAPG